MSITVHIKNMAGEITSLEVPQGTRVEEVARRLSDMDEKQFPYFRTKVMRMEQEEKEEMREEVMEGDVLISFVSAVYQIDRYIGVVPHREVLGFGIRYSSHHISFPGYTCVYEETENWKSDIRKALRRRECTPKQIYAILLLIEKGMDNCTVLDNGDVDFGGSDIESEEEEEEEQEEEQEDQ